MKFIVCYDDAQHSVNVITEAQEHARLWNATLEIVKVMSRDDPIKYSKLHEMEEELDSEIKELFQGVDIPYNVQLNVDNINRGEKIVELADIIKAKLIFLGIKKRSRVGKMLFGSTAQYVILKSPCPVVVVR